MDYRYEIGENEITQALSATFEKDMVVHRSKGPCCISYILRTRNQPIIKINSVLNKTQKAESKKKEKKKT